MNIQGKTAIVTGGASGLGAASARMIVVAGGRVVMVDLNEAAGQALAQELGAAAKFVRADVAEPADVERVIAAALETGSLHIAINCAGIAIAERVLGKEGPASLERFAKVIRVNLIGTYNVSRLAAAAMDRNQPDQEGEKGVIVNTASVAAFEGQIGQTAYSASKGGVAAMTVPLARDLARHGIRVATIAPGIFDTPMVGGMKEEVRAALAASIPFPPRLGRPAEYAALARHIIENTMLNGEVIRLDGAIRMAPK